MYPHERGAYGSSANTSNETSLMVLQSKRFADITAGDKCCARVTVTDAHLTLGAALMFGAPGTMGSSNSSV